MDFLLDAAVTWRHYFTRFFNRNIGHATIINDLILWPYTLTSSTLTFAPGWPFKAARIPVLTQPARTIEPWAAMNHFACSGYIMLKCKSMRSGVDFSFKATATWFAYQFVNSSRMASLEAALMLLSAFSVRGFKSPRKSLKLKIREKKTPRN